MDKALIIFVRNPEAGKVKTRLAKSIGDVQALKLYEFLLKHTAELVKPTGIPIYVFYAGAINENDLWDGAPFIKKQQQGTDLGARMQDAFNKLFTAGFSRLAIIGSDCYELTTGILLEAFDLLSTHDVVIGPARDGGYYLLGMKKLSMSFFQNKDWSTERVFQQTMADAKAANLSVGLLPVLNDVDEEKDIDFLWQ